MAKTIILGCGLPKTGTRSLCAALNILGIRAQHDRHFFMGRAPVEIARAAKDSEYEAFLDWPHPMGDVEVKRGDWPAFARVAALLPNSRLILTTRNRDSWLDSCLLHVLHSRITRTLDWTDIDTCAMKDEWNELHDRAHTWRAHHPGRMLLYDVSEGWEPLCEFLGRAVPSVAFPRENTASRRLLEVLHHYATRDAATRGREMLGCAMIVKEKHKGGSAEPLPDDECRKCRRRGWKVDEFTSPLTGLCAQCTKEAQEAPAAASPAASRETTTVRSRAEELLQSSRHRIEETR